MTCLTVNQLRDAALFGPGDGVYLLLEGWRRAYNGGVEDERDSFVRETSLAGADSLSDSLSDSWFVYLLGWLGVQRP